MTYYIKNEDNDDLPYEHKCEQCGEKSEYVVVLYDVKIYYCSKCPKDEI